MSGDVQLELYLHEYKMAALSDVLEEQGTSVEDKMQEMLIDLYSDLVPYEVQQEICTRIDTEHAAEQAAAEAARKYTAFHLREDGVDSFFQLGMRKDFLPVAQLLRRYLSDEQKPAEAAFQRFFAGLKAITAEEYNQMLELRMENPDRVTGVFEMDFDKREVSTVDFKREWQTYAMKDVSAAAYFAYRKSGLNPVQYTARFENKLTGKACPSAGHLSAKEISFADEICEIDGRLNFYLESSFDVDKVFGTHTAKQDGQLNIYANYNMAAGQICDELELTLIHADGHEESLSYSLNAVEKAVLLRKMDEYCQQQTGQPLADYSAQLMAEDLASPIGPVL